MHAADHDDDGHAPSRLPAHPPAPGAVTHAQLLALIEDGKWSHEVVQHVLNDHHPEWLCTRPAGALATPFHALVLSGNVRLLRMLLAEGKTILDLDAPDAAGRTVRAAAEEVQDAYPGMYRKIRDLAAFEDEAHRLASSELGDDEAHARLLAALARKLDWISTPHHKAWSILHHVVDHGDVQLLQRIVGLPGAFAKIRVHHRTKDCGRTILELGKERGEEMHEYLTRTLGPMFGVHAVPTTGDEHQQQHEAEARKAVFPRVRSVPVENVKMVYFIRHAEGTHNEAARLHGEGAYKSWEWMDAELTPVGEQQAVALQEQLLASRLMESLDLVVVSPLRRTLHTATLVFGIDTTNGGKSTHLRPHVPPFVAIEALRETAGGDPCNKRSVLSELARRFPHVDFSQVQSEEDVLYDEGGWESEESMEARGHYFLWWLGQRPERTVAVVTHGSFLMTVFERVLQAPISMRHWWENTECRGLAVHFPSSLDGKENGNGNGSK